MTERKVSFSPHLTWTKQLETKTLEEILTMIRDGNEMLSADGCDSYTLGMATEAIRGSNNPIQQNSWKQLLMPVATFNGEFYCIASGASQIKSYSDITALDFDDIYSDEEERCMWNMLTSFPFTYAVFRTFKKHRLKALVRHNNTDPLKHKDMYEQIAKLYGITKIDMSCKDLARRTYIPWDSNIWVNSNAMAFQYKPTIAPVKKAITTPLRKAQQKSPYSIRNILNAKWKREHPEYWKQGYRASSVFKCACTFCQYGVDEEIAEEYFVDGWEANDFTEDEILRHLHGAYKTADFGSMPFV